MRLCLTCAALQKRCSLCGPRRGFPALSEQMFVLLVELLCTKQKGHHTKGNSTLDAGGWVSRRACWSTKEGEEWKGVVGYSCKSRPHSSLLICALTPPTKKKKNVTVTSETGLAGSEQTGSDRVKKAHVCKHIRAVTLTAFPHLCPGNVYRSDNLAGAQPRPSDPFYRFQTSIQTQQRR